jgi:colanic acid/amylovoran biosynthesis glycosyltransferase
LIEMAATGMPIVSTTHCDIPNIILDEETGLLAPERDSEGLAARILWLANNTDQWQRLTLAARARVEDQFNAKSQALRLVQLYQAL